LGSHTAKTWIVAIACSVGATACKSADTMLVIVPLEPPPVVVNADRIEFTIAKAGATPLVRKHLSGFEAATAKYGLQDIAGSYAGTISIHADGWRGPCKVATTDEVTADLVAGKSNDVPTLHARVLSCDSSPTDAGEPDAGSDGASPPPSDAGVDAAGEDTRVVPPPPDAAPKPDAPAWNLFAPQFMQGDQPTSPRLAAISGDRTLLAWRKSGNPAGISVGDLQLPDHTALSNPKTDSTNPPAGLALIQDGMLPNPHPYIAWAESSKIVVKRYDGSAPWVQLGDSFGAPGATSPAECPALLFDSSGQLVVAWSQGSPVASVYLRTWNDPSWAASYAGPLRGGMGDSTPACPLLAARGPTTLAAAWVEGPAQGKLIYVQRYVAGGWQTWGAPLPANPMATAVKLGGLVLDADGLPTVAWQEATPGKSTLFVRRWDKAGMWIQAGNAIPEITVPGADGPPALAIDARSNTATPLLAWFEYSNGNLRVRVWQLNGDTWQTVGNSLRGASGDPAELSLSYGGGVPWVVFTDVSTVSRGLYPFALR
jgi:hypothetical protein